MHCCDVTYVFADNLLQGMRKNFPAKNFDVLLDVARFGCRKAHNNFEKFFAIGLSLRHRQWSKTFQIAADPVLLLDSEAYID